MKKQKMYIDINEIDRVKEEIRGLVIAPMDRHKGEITISCPCRYHDTITRIYENDEKVTINNSRGKLQKSEINSTSQRRQKA